MIHPSTELKFINAEIGFGVFATDFIPAGAITYITDPLEMVIHPSSPYMQIPEYRDTFFKYSHVEPDGIRILSWDIARYMNHSCDPNTLSTGYGFEIAIRDIAKGEHVTDDYGLFIGPEELDCTCGSPHCRHHIDISSFDENIPQWDVKAKAGLKHFRDAFQPLAKFMNPELKSKLDNYLDTGRNYVSVKRLKWTPPAMEIPGKTSEKLLRKLGCEPVLS